MNRLALLLIALAAGPRVWGQTYEIHTTSDLTLQLQVPAPKPRVLFWSKAGRWEPLSLESLPGAIRFTLAVAKLSNGHTTLLVGVSDDVDINDREPPSISVQVDGRPLASGEKPAVLEKAPTLVTCTVEDAANRIDAKALRVRIDGREIAAKTLKTAAGGKRVTFEAQLRAIDFGAHSLAVTAQDVSPFRNRAEAAASFTFVNTADLAQASFGATVKVDSCYPNYTAAVLIDGDWQSGAASGSPDVTWASAETETDHWAIVELPKPHTVVSVSVFWVRKKPSQRIEVQVQKDGKWIAVGSAEPRQDCTATTIRIPRQTVKAVRVFQPKGKGLPDRPNLIWIGEIAVNRP